jgi:hypothetical protein
MIAKYKHFATADLYSAATEFINQIGEERLITVTSNAYQSNSSPGNLRNGEKVTVWYWGEK